MDLIVTEIVSNEGTIVVFGTRTGHRIAVDHRTAEPIAQALYESEGGVPVHAEPWQVL